MPRARKLETDEVEKNTTGPRAQTAQAYTNLLADFAPGEYGEATLLAGERRATVRNRLQAAAKRRDMVLVFRRTSGDTMVFLVAPAGTPLPRRKGRTTMPAATTAPSTSPQPRGRPRAAPAVTHLDAPARGRGPAPAQGDAPARGRGRGERQSRYSDMLPRWMREEGDGTPPRRGGRSRR